MNEQNATQSQFPVSLTWWPVTVLTAAVDGYFEAFFACFPSWGRK